MQEVYRQRVKNMFDVMDEYFSVLSLDNIIEETNKTAFGNRSFSGIRNLKEWNYSSIPGYVGDLKLWIKWRYLKQVRAVYREHGPNYDDYIKVSSQFEANWMQVMICCEMDGECVEINLLWNMIPIDIKDTDPRAWRVNSVSGEPFLEEVNYLDAVMDPGSRGCLMFKPLAERLYEREKRRWKQKNQISEEQE